MNKQRLPCAEDELVNPSGKLFAYAVHGGRLSLKFLRKFILSLFILSLSKDRRIITIETFSERVPKPWDNPGFLLGVAGVV